jgi:hypothetical protein
MEYSAVLSPPDAYTAMIAGADFSWSVTDRPDLGRRKILVNLKKCRRPGET